VKDVLKNESLKLEIGGASNMKAQIKVSDLHLEVTGASQVALSGEAAKMKAEISGAASLKASELKVKDADMEATGAAKACIEVSENLKAEASGAGNISYGGNPKNKSCEARSAGYIKNLDAPGSSGSCNSGSVKMYDSKGSTYNLETSPKSKDDKKSGKAEGR
jgi:hypothetical protein